MTTDDTMRPHHGVLTLTGYGLLLAVERGHLVVEDGVANRRRRARYSRIDQTLKRVVVIGHSGVITLDAIDWLRGVGVPLIHLDHDGRVYFVSSPAARGIAQLRRAQARAAGTDIGFAISRDLVLGKIEGQLGVLDQLPDGAEAQEPLSELRRDVERAPHLKAVKDLEARAARAYWRAWRGVPLMFRPADAKRRPRHWRVFGSRISPLADPSPRRAVNPANAVLNYLYAMLEAEATIAALAARLDPMLGFVHTDRQERASLACDLMEPVRPVVDAFALSLLRARVFTKDDVFERHDGHCRLLPALTHQLAATAPLWAYYVRPVADQVAKALVNEPRKGKNIVPGVSMPRTGAKRRPRGRTAVVRGFEEVPAPTWAAFQQPDHPWRGMRKFRRQLVANRAWERDHGLADPRYYRRKILPKLAQMPLRQLVAATGLSMSTCSLIRRGLQVPHPRHWEALRDVASGSVEW